MKRFLRLLCVLLCLALLPLPALGEDSAPNVRVLLRRLNLTDRADLTDDLYADASLHDAHGAWQMIFGVNTLPDYRRHGYAGQLLERATADARAQGRRGLVLTCKDRLVHYYAKFGFVSEGVSASTHGGVVWYQMRLTF